MMRSVTQLLAISLWLLAANVSASFESEGFITDYTVDRHSEAQYLFVFGDSYSKVVFDIDKAAPSSENPIGNPAFPGDTTSGGNNWATFLISKYNKSSIFSYNFAFGGATVDNSIIDALLPGIPDLVQQSTTFFEHLPKSRAVRWPGEHSIAAFWFGQNDIFISENKSTPNTDSVFERVLDSYFDRAGDLYHAGVRNFLFIGAAPIVRTPLFMTFSKSAQDETDRLSKKLNRDLYTQAQTFASSHDGIRWHYYDPAEAFDRVLEDPKKYGAPDATCYNGDGATCLWWNDFHPGLAIHDAVAADIANNGTFSSFFTPHD